MKTMKFFLILFLVLGGTSCSSDDDVSPDENREGDKIVGKWRIESHMMDGEEIELSDCDAQTTLEFLANGSLIVKSFFEDEETAECLSETFNETWTYRGNNIFRITDEGTVNDITIEFSNNNTVFTLEQEEGDILYAARYVKI